MPEFNVVIDKRMPRKEVIAQLAQRLNVATDSGVVYDLAPDEDGVIVREREATEPGTDPNLALLVFNAEKENKNG